MKWMAWERTGPTNGWLGGAQALQLVGTGKDRHYKWLAWERGKGQALQIVGMGKTGTTGTNFFVPFSFLVSVIVYFLFLSFFYIELSLSEFYYSAFSLS